MLERRGVYLGLNKSLGLDRRRFLTACFLILTLVFIPCNVYAKESELLDEEVLKKLIFDITSGFDLKKDKESTFDTKRTITGTAEEGTMVTVYVYNKAVDGLAIWYEQNAEEADDNIDKAEEVSNKDLSNDTQKAEQNISKEDKKEAVKSEVKKSETVKSEEEKAEISEDEQEDTQPTEIYEIEVVSSGIFSQSIELELGDNTIVLVFEKENCQTVVKQFNITRKSRDIKEVLENGIVFPGTSLLLK